MFLSSCRVNRILNTDDSFYSYHASGISHGVFILTKRRSTMTSAQQQNRNEDNRQEQSGSRSNSNQSSGRGQDNLSDAAQKMRSGNPQERSEGAQEMGKAGGQQSHKNDNQS